MSSHNTLIVMDTFGELLIEPPLIKFDDKVEIPVVLFSMFKAKKSKNELHDRFAAVSLWADKF